MPGTGRHFGDDGVAVRMPFSWEPTAQLHADLVFLVCGLALALLFTLRAVGAPTPPPAEPSICAPVWLPRPRSAIGSTSPGLPEWLVGIHVAGACLVCIATRRIPSTLREQTTADEGEGQRTAEGSDAGAEGRGRECEQFDGGRPLRSRFHRCATGRRHAAGTDPWCRGKIVDNDRVADDQPPGPTDRPVVPGEAPRLRRQ